MRDAEKGAGVAFGVSVLWHPLSSMLREISPAKLNLYSLVRIEEVRNQGILDYLFPV